MSLISLKSEKNNMNKFTIFTVILAICVVTVTADLVLRDYFANGAQHSGEASVLNEEISPVISDVLPSEPTDILTAKEPETETLQEIRKPPAPTITQDIVKKAGFTGVLTEQFFNGKFFQLLDITKIPVESIGFYELEQDGGKIATITEIALQDEIRALQLYVLLQNKTKPYIDLTLNETNAYGDRSFYINHAKKPEEAFLTVKIGSKLYGFAYVKFYHPELKNLISLLNP